MDTTFDWVSRKKGLKKKRRKQTFNVQATDFWLDTCSVVVTGRRRSDFVDAVMAPERLKQRMVNGVE